MQQIFRNSEITDGVGDVGEKHEVFNSRTDMDGQAIPFAHQLLTDDHAIIPPAIVEDYSFYR